MKNNILECFRKLKSDQQPLTLNFVDSLGQPCQLKAITNAVLEEPEDIERLAKWRAQNAAAFPAQFLVTIEGTKAWIQKALIEQPERVLFWVLDTDHKKIGHVGLFRLVNEGQGIELDNIIRGEIPRAKSIIQLALERLIEWQRSELKIPQSFLRVFSDNERAIRLYEKMGFQEIQRVPLKSVKAADRTDWVEIIKSHYEIAEKYFVTMYQFKQAVGRNVTSNV